MEKQKRWQFYLIVAVMAITLYNILPTLFFYSKPLQSPIDAPRSEQVASAIVDRVNTVEVDSKEWLYSFCRLLGIKPTSIDLVTTNSGLFQVSFKNEQDAELFKRFLPRAGALIPFVPAQLELSSDGANLDPTQVLVQRNIAVHLDASDMDKLFQFTPKYSQEHQVADLYREIVGDRVSQVALAIGGPSKAALQMSMIVNQGDADSRYDDATVALAKEIVDMDNILGKNNPITKRYYASFSQLSPKDGEGLTQKFIAKMEALSKKVKERQVTLQADSTSEAVQTLAVLNNQAQALDTAVAIMRKNGAEFQKGNAPLTVEKIQNLLDKSASNQAQVLDLTGYHPFVKGLTIDWESSQLMLNLYDDVLALRNFEGKSEKEAFVKERVNQYLINDIARIARLSDEVFKPSEDTFVVELDNLTNSQSYLTLNLGYLANKRAQQVMDQLLLSWVPSHTDLIRDAYPIRSYDTYKTQKSEDQKLGLVVYAPAMYGSSAPAGFRNGSIYVIAKGMDAIVQKYQEAPEAAESQALAADFSQLNTTLQQMGFIGYPGSAFNLPKEFSKDYIFELNDYYSTLLKATREDFQVKGSKRFAVLDFSDVEQRLLTINKIDDRIQEDLLKWKESYNAAQVDLNLTSKYTVPAPTKNVYWENLKLSAAKYFRGDDRKVLKWGLDLSGGKTVRIGLLDQNGRPVTNPEDLKQAVNELYNRINKMGVAERTIRIENSNILLDFPGSQNLSASDLVKASAMYFHIVNEKFGSQNATLAGAVNQFLQDVWNEAVVTNRKDVDSINEIAWQQLGGDVNDVSTRPRSDHAKLLYDNGLRFANPKDRVVSQAFDESLSAIAMFRGGDSAEWDNQTHPLLVVFHNFALEGSNLENIQPGYDATQGNILTFGIKRSFEGSSGSGSPRDDFYTWTSQFAEDKIAGTPKEAYSKGRGWRMAVILNGTVITAPSLNSALRDGGTISGRFSQREVTQLAADLKAGSLSFTPRILSEENVSPELGHEERTKGILASLVALTLVVAAMIGYYRFAGLVASCAVLLNIFIMWGVLQNLGAALTLPGIAGIVLTIGMAVDANVLVFERIREEFKLTGRIASAIQAGYRKAFSAIIDSNITTLIAAIILIQFDSGPIKGFAVTLIIGIISSMFTALFMTRYFFAGWVRNPENKQLSMAQFLKETHFDFLGQAKKAIAISLIVMLIGTYFLVTERKTIFGMDFTGGYSLTVDVAEKNNHPDYRLEAINAFLDKGASRRDFEVRELSRPNQLRIQLGTSMDEKGHPFYQMPEINAEGKYAYDYQKDPRLNWVVETLQSHGLEVQPSQLATLQKNWTIMSGQFSDAMRNNAIFALAAALIAILLYITFRFEFKFAVGAVAGLVHDVIITLGILALFHALGFPVQIDLQVIGAIMTIIGYSLNDTIIVFDRIREDMKTMRRMSFKDIINHALNVTLSRTIMTSGTTLLVLLALVILGGQSIFAFSLVMTIGVLIGTLSSLFIASPVMLYFHNKEVEHQHNGESAAKRA
ncbi:bifunctional preprotein translocase subunit SecD/SecF [Candidatus Protochlamydia naegleriophila]|uniref:Multifunctional fusion protein n=1 Tax=Candidatus Protochlamydia naegleriophila TaxID=389348 RepID=A0A0U5JAU3_9BACT|nr:protein translocase subunit SecDF [Candidatus Protochlamydia naegleriophila]CUI15908.1 bifunctional preprotein translocase subunit SecD/SecF [Candidatus Protochlamydia naegleriophila]